MPRTSVTNDTEAMLCLWLEPWGSDHWMRPGGRFTVVAGDCAEPADAQFETIVHDQGISVWVNAATTAEVIDADGNEIPSGYQRPIEVVRQWTMSAREAVQRVADNPPQVRQAVRSHYELMLRILDATEARDEKSTSSDQAGKPGTTE